MVSEKPDDLVTLGNYIGLGLEQAGEICRSLRTRDRPLQVHSPADNRCAIWLWQSSGDHQITTATERIK